MGYLDSSTITVDAILTKRGRELIARNDGSFKITQFALGDDEIDYTLFNEDHPNGSQFSGEAIENMPLIEAIPDENNIMVHRLITLNQGTSKLPLLTVGGGGKITLNLGGSETITPATLNFNDIASQAEPGGYLFTVADRRLFSNFGSSTGLPSDNVLSNNSRTAFSQTVSGNSVNITALNSTSLFGNNTKLVTTITVEGRDTGARVTIPIEISKTLIGTTAVQGQTGVQLK